MGKFQDRVRKTKFDTHLYVVGGPFSPQFMVQHNNTFGLDDWIPEVNPPSTDNFCGVNRSVDPIRCAGLRLSAVGLSPEEAIVWGRRECFRHAARPDTLLVPESFSNFPWAQLDFEDSLGKLKVFVEDGLQDTVFLLQEDTWELRDSCLICAVPGLNARMMVSGGYSTSVRREGPCHNCGKTNDVGVKSCWWCEAPNPARG